MSPDAALTACRFLHFASVMCVWGAAAFLAALVPGALVPHLGRKLRVAAGVTVAIAVITTPLMLVAEVASIGSGWADAADPAVVRDVLTATDVGVASAAQAVAALLLLGTLAIRRPLRLAAMAVSAAIMLVTLPLTGHAAMHDGWVRLIHSTNDALHLLAGGAWLGALVPLLLILSSLGDPAYRRDAEVAVRRFSVAGHVVVAVVVATGIINVGLVLGRWPLDWASPYQALLAAKVFVVAAMVGLAVANRYILVPRMVSARRGALAAIRATTGIEIVLALAAVGLVSRFGMLDPV